MYKILIAEHDRTLANQLVNALSRSFSVDEAFNGVLASELARRSFYDGFVLDIHLPELNSLDMCTRLRESGNTAPIFVIGSNSSAQEQELVLSRGADQYLCRPVIGRDLTARLNAAIRRRQSNGYMRELVCNDIVLDLVSGKLTKGDQVVKLRPMERSLLEFLLRNQDRLFSVDQLWHEVWKERGVAADTVRAHINLLRKKLRQFDSEHIIKTVNGFGYKLVSDEHRR